MCSATPIFLPEFNKPGMPRHLLSLRDYSGDEIRRLIEAALILKKTRPMGGFSDALRGKNIAMIFEKPSTRTRASFTVAALELGASTVYYRKDELQLVRGEPVKDVIRVFSRYHHLVAARVYSHSTLEEMAEYSRIPVVNLLSDVYHPLQSLADYMTLLEKKGRLEGLKIAFIGDGRDNVFNSLAIAGAKLGVEVRVATPEGYDPNPRLLGGVEPRVYRDPCEAVKGVDAVYTDVFVSMGQEGEREKRLRDFLPRYRVDRGIIECSGRDDVLFMHCLPAHRGEEVTDDVIEGEWSVVFDQAENRLHTSKAVLLYLLGGLTGLGKVE